MDEKAWKPRRDGYAPKTGCPLAPPDTKPVPVIATKYTTCYKSKDTKILANFTGNSTKSMHVSVNDSLKKLQTDYIDLLYGEPRRLWTNAVLGPSGLIPPSQCTGGIFPLPSPS